MSGSDPASAAERMLGLVSPRVGVLRDLSRVVRGPSEPEPPIIYQGAPVTL